MLHKYEGFPAPLNHYHAGAFGSFAQVEGEYGIGLEAVIQPLHTVDIGLRTAGQIGGGAEPICHGVARNVGSPVGVVAGC